MTNQTKTIGGRVWEPARFFVQPRLDVKLRKPVDGYVHGNWGIFKRPSKTGSEDWFHLVDLKGEATLMMFDSFGAAAVASLIEDALTNHWPTFFNDCEYGRPHRDDFLWHSGFGQFGSFCYEESLPVWGLREDDPERVLRQAA